MWFYVTFWYLFIDDLVHRPLRRDVEAKRLSQMINRHRKDREAVVNHRYVLVGMSVIVPPNVIGHDLSHAHQKNEHLQDVHPYDVHPQNAHLHDVHLQDAHPHGVHPQDVHLHDTCPQYLLHRDICKLILWIFFSEIAEFSFERMKLKWLFGFIWFSLALHRSRTVHKTRTIETILLHIKQTQQQDASRYVSGHNFRSSIL